MSSSSESPVATDAYADDDDEAVAGMRSARVGASAVCAGVARGSSAISIDAHNSSSDTSCAHVWVVASSTPRARFQKADSQW